MRWRVTPGPSAHSPAVTNGETGRIRPALANRPDGSSWREWAGALPLGEPESVEVEA